MLDSGVVGHVIAPLLHCCAAYSGLSNCSPVSTNFDLIFDVEVYPTKYTKKEPT